MDKLDRYRDIIEQVLAKHVFNSDRYPHLRDRTVFDRRSNNFLVLREGWDQSERAYGVVVHLEIINGKIWVQEDWTEHGVAGDLEEAGVPKSDIVLGFQPPQVRPYTEYAAAQPSAAIIASGGWAITREENRKLMSRLGVTVWLDAPFELCWRRIQNDGATRPLAPDELTAKARYEGRLALYRQASIHTPINQSHSPDDISETIINQLREVAEK